MTDLPLLKDRFAGCLLGLAVGDALGSHFEGQSADWIGRRYPTPEALIANPPEAPWHYTDDTQMAIGVAEALVKDGEIIEQSLCEAFVENYEPYRGYGRGAKIILQAMEEGQDYKHWANDLFPGGSFGNGAAMRVAPIGLLFHRNVDRLWEQARLSALPTHVHPLGIEGAQLLALTVAIALRDDPFGKRTSWEELRQRATTADFQDRVSLVEQVQSPDDVLRLGNGIAAQDSVVTAIACFTLWPDSYEDVVANAIFLGGDTDAIAAMAGAISGAHLGIHAIPCGFSECREDERKGKSYLEQLADQLSEKIRCEPSCHSPCQRPSRCG